MRILFIILWLILFGLYYWIWGRQDNTCCNQEGQNTSLSDTKPVDDLADSATKEIDESAAANESDTYQSDQNENGDAASNGLTPEEDTNNDGIADSEQDFTNEDLSSLDVGSIDPNESEGDVAKVVETDDRALIHFPYNSTYKLDSKAIEEYLNKVAQRVQQSGEKIQLTGHGDITGTDRSNMQIGQHRANTIRDYLIGKGVNPTQIMAISKGRSEPIASNKTREGRAKNRRVELVIVKN